MPQPRSWRESRVCGAGMVKDMARAAKSGVRRVGMYILAVCAIELFEKMRCWFGLVEEQVDFEPG